MVTLKEKIKNLDLSKIDMGQISLAIAEGQMRTYEERRHSRNAGVYLHIAETNLMGATRKGKDTTLQYERLRRLQSEY